MRRTSVECSAGCLLDRHDALSLGASTLLTALAASVAVLAVGRGRETAERRRLAWVLLGALAFGGGVWSAEAIALLGLDLGRPMRFALAPALAAAGLAVGLGGIGLAVWAWAEDLAADTLAGFWLAAGAVAVKVALLAATLPLGSPPPGPGVLPLLLPGVVLVSAAPLIARGNTARAAGGAVLLALGLLALHIGLTAALAPPPPEAEDLPDLPFWPLMPAIGLGVMALTATLVAIGLLGSAAVRSEATARMQGLADAAFEGIAICSREVVLEANGSLAALVGTAREALAGRPVQALFEPGDRIAVLAAVTRATGDPFVAGLTGPDGRLPVEVRIRPLPDQGAERRIVVTLRDLRAELDAEARIRYLANHDALTGLANRTRLAAAVREAATRALRRRTGLAAVAVDIDRFKSVNDRHGHATGDALLGLVAERLAEVAGPRTLVARNGGDEFVVLVDGGDAAAPRRMAEAVLAALCRPVPVPEGPLVPISVSVGCALLPEDTRDPEELIRHAATAAAHAKAEGGGRWVVFRPAMDAALRARRALEADLPHALERGELRLVYQRQTDARTGATVGFEALLRWRRPGQGEVSPAEFVPLAEASGEIVPIGAWALRRACADALGWPSGLRVSVNVSPLQIERGGLPEAVAAALGETGLPPERLELEVTEGLLIADAERAEAVLARIRARGVRLALDDFGAGYASLSTLLRFRFDKVKMDRSLVQDIGHDARARAVVRATLGLARELGLGVVAEGVETTAQLALLREEGPIDIQGYINGGPMEVVALTQEFAAAC